MNGAESLVKTMLQNGVDTVFANPGTSEMHFVAALDDNPDMRCVLCLFEGGTTGAADAYYRMSGKVAVTLLHLAPGFGNAYANAHNARKAGSGILNVVGDHATYHLRYESPLKGDIEGVTRAMVAPRPDAKGRVLTGLGSVIHLGDTESFLLMRRAALFVEKGESGARVAGGSREVRAGDRLACLEPAQEPP